MINMMGVEYGRGATARIVDGGPANAPAVVREMFPNANWTIVTAHPVNPADCMADRFGDAFEIHKKIFAATPAARHIFIGGDHSVNFGHVAAMARIGGFNADDLCMVYIDAHLDIHTPQSSVAQATGSPHGTNVRALLGDGDARWLSLTNNAAVLKPENIFYIGVRSYEAAEIEFVRANNIFMRTPEQIKGPARLSATIDEIRAKIGNRPFVVSFDFDSIDPTYFPDVLVPERDGIDVDTARYLVGAFRDAYGFEFVEYSPTGNAQCAAIARELIGIVAGE